jgi:hypothetical protein
LSEAAAVQQELGVNKLGLGSGPERIEKCGNRRIFM